MNSQTIVMCVVALILGILLANMLKNICGCNKVVEPGIFNAVAYGDSVAIYCERCDETVDPNSDDCEYCRNMMSDY